MAQIHPTAIVHPNAQLAESCKIGAYAFIDEFVVVGEGTDIRHGCHFSGKVTVGKNNVFYPYCCIGGPPQDVSYKGDLFAVEMGDNNVLREFCTVNMGTQKEQGVTVLGNNNYFMAYVHVGHDCRIGNHVTLINNVGLSGHTHVEDFAILSGLTGVHHYTTIGQYAFIGGMSRIIHDAPPFMMTEGNPSRVHRVNTVGLQRHNFAPENIEALKAAHRILYRSKLTRQEAFGILEGSGPTAEVRCLIDFLKRQMAGRQGRQREILRMGVKH